MTTTVARIPWFICVCLSLSASNAAADETPAYASAMKKVAAGFKGEPGVVLHVGDSITYANPYGQWARFGAGQTESDIEILKWMHVNKRNDRDGWHLAAVDRPGNRSETACSGIRADEMLAGGKSEMPPLADLVKKYQPQMVVVMLGTNDASAGRDADAYLADMAKCVDTILAGNAICILSTIPPHPGKTELAKSYNEGLRKLAADRRIPLIDYELEILTRRPKDWNGTLLGKDDVHPTSGAGNISAAAPPTAENLKVSGYLLRGWLSVQKIKEVKEYVLD
jgi:lysophospholipase L1-like esterase